MAAATIPASALQADCPIYDYDVAIHEATNSQFVAFLNDAEFHNEVQNPGFCDDRGNNPCFWPSPLNSAISDSSTARRTTGSSMSREVC